MRAAEAGIADLTYTTGEPLNMFSQLQESALKVYVNVVTLISDERGQDLIEYALLAALISVACVAGMNNVATILKTLFGSISTELGAA